MCIADTHFAYNVAGTLFSMASKCEIPERNCTCQYKKLLVVLFCRRMENFCFGCAWGQNVPLLKFWWISLLTLWRGDISCRWWYWWQIAEVLKSEKFLAGRQALIKKQLFTTATSGRIKANLYVDSFYTNFLYQTVFKTSTWHSCRY